MKKAESGSETTAAPATAGGSGTASPGRLAIKQERGHITYDALIEAGFKLLAERDIEDISIFELSRVAGYSVGAFYARFRSKDEFFDKFEESNLAFLYDPKGSSRFSKFVARRAKKSRNSAK